MKPIISFCIPVFNQADLVRSCLESIIEYKGHDIEIIISDDMSTENIKGIIDKYNDIRIKYYCNECNIGHDLNIVKAIEYAKGRYVFILRTRDKIISAQIPFIIQKLQRSEASYITGSALNQNMKKKLEYKRDNYEMGKDAIDAHYNLFFHPSGNIYNTSKLSINKIADFIKRENITKYDFIVHNLIRIQLAISGNFVIITNPIWIYTDTEKETDIAVNHIPNGLNVYDPILIKRRFMIEVSWSKEILPREYQYYNILHLIKLYLNIITWGFKLINSDKFAQYHYQFIKKRFSLLQQEKSFRRMCESLYSEEFGIERKRYFQDINRIFWNNRISGFIVYVVRKTTYRSSLYHFFSIIFKKYIKGI